MTALRRRILRLRRSLAQRPASDFTASGNTVSYSGPAEWSYRRFILHYAHLCAAAARVEAFLIGSELRGLTQIRGAAGSFPVVEALRVLAADVRGILGAGSKNIVCCRLVRIFRLSAAGRQQ